MSNKTIVTAVVIVFLFLPIPTLASNGLQHPKLPKASELATAFSNYQTLSSDELRAKVTNHIKTLANLLDNEKRSFQSFAEQINSGSYLNQMTRREMLAILVLEDIRAILRQ